MATCSSGRSLGVLCCCCCDDDCWCWLERPRSVSLDRLVVRLITSRMLFLDFFDLVLSSPRWTIEWIGWRSSLWCGDGGCWWWNWGECCGWGWWWWCWRVSYATPCWLWWCWVWCDVALLDLLAEVEISKQNVSHDSHQLKSIAMTHQAPTALWPSSHDSIYYKIHPTANFHRSRIRFADIWGFFGRFAALQQKTFYLNVLNFHLSS